MTITLPDYQDEVRHIATGISGVVIATYEENETSYLDVCVDDRVYYKTPAENWETTVAYEE